MMSTSDSKTRSQSTLRADFTIIANMLLPGARVLDLGCGDGALFKFLKSTRGIKGYGKTAPDKH